MDFSVTYEITNDNMVDLEAATLKLRVPQFSTLDGRRTRLCLVEKQSHSEPNGVPDGPDQL